MYDETGECKVLIINHDNIIPTSCTFLMYQFLTTNIVWRHVIALPSDMVYHMTLQKFSYLYVKFYKICVCSIRVIENTNIINYVSGYYRQYINSEGQRFSKEHHNKYFPDVFLNIH